MRTINDIATFERAAREKYLLSCQCGGANSRCDCNIKFNIAVQQYTACLPRDFVITRDEMVKYNRGVFKKIIVKYANSINLALKRGYGLVLTGDNGCGKSFFGSYILNVAIQCGRTAYYTNVLDLEYNIKAGFDDVEIKKQLEWMLTSDFLFVDELGKEKRKSRERTYTDTQIERILRKRYDENGPVLIATNLSIDGLKSAYGSTVGSMMAGKSKIVQLSPGDFRLELGTRMSKEMGY